MNITIEDREGISIVRPEGSVVRDNQGELRAKVEEAVAGKPRGVALDFAKVDYIDSAGLGCCVGIHKLLFDKKVGSLVLFNASPNVEKMWRMIRLDLIIPVLPDEGQALDFLKKERRPVMP